MNISVPLAIDTGLELSVRFDGLFKLLSGMLAGDIDLEFDGTYLKIINSDTHAGIAAKLLDEKMLGMLSELGLENIGKEQWHPLPEGFCQGIKMCGISVEPIPDHPSSCVKITPKAIYSGMRNYGSGHWRISRYKFAYDLPVSEFILPFDLAAALPHRDVTEIQQAGRWVHFRNEEGLIISTLPVNRENLYEEFPDFEDCFQFDGMTLDLTDKELRQELRKGMNQMLVFAHDDDDYFSECPIAEMLFLNDRIVLRAENERGNITRMVPAPTLLINPKFFFDVLQYATSMTLGHNVALFNDGNFDHLTRVAFPNKAKDDAWEYRDPRQIVMNF